MFGSLRNFGGKIFGSLMPSPIKNAFGAVGQGLLNLGEKIKSIPVIGNALGKIGDTIGTGHIATGIKDMDFNRIRDGYMMGVDNLNKTKRFFQR